MTTCGASPYACAKDTSCGDTFCTTNFCSSQSEFFSSCSADCMSLNYSSTGDVQGIAVTYPYNPHNSHGPHDRFAISYNRYGTPASAISNGCDGSTFDSSNLPRVLWASYDNVSTVRYVTVRQELYPSQSYFLHPGGMQSTGRYVAVGVDGNDEADIMILFLSSSSWQNKRVVTTLSQRKSQFSSGKARAEAVAIVDQGNGKFLLVSGQEHGKKLVLWESTGTDIETTGWNLIGQLESPSSQYSGYNGVLGGNLNFNNLALIRERGTNDIYLLGLSNYPNRCSPYGAGCGNTPSGDDSIIVPFKYDSINHSFMLVTLPNGKNYVYLKEPCGSLDTCPNFVAGGNVFVNNKGYIEARATEHWTDGGPDLDVLKWWD